MLSHCTMIAQEKRKRAATMLQTEVEIVSQLRHPHIGEIFAIIDTSTCVIMVMEYLRCVVRNAASLLKHADQVTSVQWHGLVRRGADRLRAA